MKAQILFLNCMALFHFELMLRTGLHQGDMLEYAMILYISQGHIAAIICDI